MAFAKNDLDFVRGEMKIVKKANKLVASPKKKKADKPAQEAAAE
jgi:hypothetical protein